MAKVILPRLDNATAESIIDECAPLQEKFREIEKLTKFYKAALHARLADIHKVDELTSVVTGEHYIASISTEERTVIDLGKVAQLLTPEQLEQCKSTTLIKTIRFMARTPGQGAVTKEDIDNWIKQQHDELSS